MKLTAELSIDILLELAMVFQVGSQLKTQKKKEEKEWKKKSFQSSHFLQFSFQGPFFLSVGISMTFFLGNRPEKKYNVFKVSGGS